MEIQSSSRNNFFVNNLYKDSNLPLSIYNQKNNSNYIKKKKTNNEINKEKIYKNVKNYKLFVISDVIISVVTITIIIVKCLPSNKSKFDSEGPNNGNNDINENQQSNINDIFKKKYSKKILKILVIKNNYNL